MSNEASSPITEEPTPSGQSLGALAQAMGIMVDLAPKMTLARVGDFVAKATMPVLGNTQPRGLLHGGASAVLAETVGSVAAQLLAPEGMAAVGTELNISHHRPARSGEIVAKATLVHLGRTTCAFEIAGNGSGRTSNRFGTPGLRIRVKATLNCAFALDINPRHTAGVP